MGRFYLTTLFLTCIFILCISDHVQAHESRDHYYPVVQIEPAASNNQRPIVQITNDSHYRYIQSNGIPEHSTGTFPNKQNPNRISEQSHSYRVAISPRVNSQPSEQGGVMGIALNGIPIEPATAECWSASGKRQQARPGSSCDWREEAIISGSNRRLGLDTNNAHVQPTGTYHYHGIPWGLVNSLRNTGDLVHVGYAADGFRILVSRNDRFKSSYRLKSGTRPSGPGGRHDGTYTADYEYNSKAKGLDHCNGLDLDGEYVYFLTQTFPFAPRCLMGNADETFSSRQRGSRSSQQGQGYTRGGPHGSGYPPPHRRY